MHQSSFIHSPLGGHFGCCQFLAITSNAAINIHVQVSARTWVPSSLGRTPRSAPATLCGEPTFSFEETAEPSSKAATPFYFPTRNDWEFLLLCHVLLPFGVVIALNFSHYNRCVGGALFHSLFSSRKNDLQGPLQRLPPLWGLPWCCPQQGPCWSQSYLFLFEILFQTLLSSLKFT